MSILAVTPTRRTRSTRSSRGPAKNASSPPAKPRGRGRGGGRRGKGRGRGKAAKPETESSEEESSDTENKANGVDASEDGDKEDAATTRKYLHYYYVALLLLISDMRTLFHLKAWLSFASIYTCLKSKVFCSTYLQNQKSVYLLKFYIYLW